MSSLRVSDPSSQSNSPRRLCLSGKHAYSCRLEAESALATALRRARYTKLGSPPKSAYQCHDCWAWHLSSWSRADWWRQVAAMAQQHAMAAKAGAR